MKYPDEKVQTSAVQLAKRRKYASDIDALISDYEHLRKKEKAATAKAVYLAKDLGAVRRARDEHKSAQAKLAQENQVLKDTLRALRGSQSLRIGKLVTRPANAARKIPARLKFVLRQVVKPVPPLSALPPGAGTPKPVTASVPAGDPSGVPAEIADVHQELLAAHAKAPSKGSLYRLLSHEYFVRGDILVPEERILAAGDLFADASDQERTVIENIKGQAALLRRQPVIARRQSNYGYSPERARVMYCAHSTGRFNSNGYSTRTAGLVAGLQAGSEDVFVVARPGYPWDSETDIAAPGARRFSKTVAGVKHIFNPRPSWSGDRLDFYLAESADIYVREAQRHRAGVIHAASNYVTALPALIAARRLGVPFVYEVRGLWEVTEQSARPYWVGTDRFRLSAELETLVAAEADEVLAITTQVRDELVRRGVDAAKISVLPNSVNTNEFTVMPPIPGLRQKLGITESCVVVGYAGSLVAYEGLDDLLRAMSLVADAGVEAHLVVVGDGRQLPDLKRFAADLGIARNVTFTGRVPASAVPNYVSIFDIMPCPRHRLPITEMVSPLKPLEAMASGKATVLSDLAPLRELAGANQERALLCLPGNPESLAAALVKLAQDPDLRTAQGRRARLWTVGNRTWEQTGRMALDAHQRVRALAGTDVVRVSPKELTIGIIADQFTLTSLADEAQFVVLRPEAWQEQLTEQPIDALFVESAWEGIEGLWRRKVGFYGDEDFSTLRGLLAYCNTAAIPTIFWNKEDPVHFNRFRVTAKYFDHVFTTDADCIRRYWENAGTRLKTVASLPFYAQPSLHNILPTARTYAHAVSYAGSFYGDKYPKRSEELNRLLTAAKPHGLAIYDRQHLNPESPYHFPDPLLPFVRGGLDYTDMVEAYKAHPVHINVNSVSNSPTMFSRRVAELAGAGAAVVSGAGRGVSEVLNGLVPVVTRRSDAELLLSEWMGNERVRLRDAWLPYRAVHRAHTAAHRLAYVLRVAGLQVNSPTAPSFGVFLPEVTDALLRDLARQTERPSIVYCPDVVAGHEFAGLSLKVAVDFQDALKQSFEDGLAYLGTMPLGISDRTAFEDLLTATTFGTWKSLGYSEASLSTPGLGLAQYGEPDTKLPFLVAVAVAVAADGRARELRLRRELIRTANRRTRSTVRQPAGGKVLVAGHDLKFAGSLMNALEAAGNSVSIDKWQDHNKHDVEQSKALLEDAEIIFCEWGLGNAVWYSNHKKPHQRLVVRVHSQEIFRPYLRRIDFSVVDQVIFVGQHIANIAIRDHGVPATKVVIVPNPVDVGSLTTTKAEDARFNLGLVGIVPAQKGLGKALDVLKELRSTDARYKLFVKGKLPEDFAWMASRPAEMAYYEEQYARIANDPNLQDAVQFDAHGTDMPAWYAKIGVVLSTSEFESFHMTLADGAASGAVPVSLAWPGADQIYPVTWLAADVAGMVRRISGLTNDLEARGKFVHEASEFVRHAFADANPVYEDVILGKAIHAGDANE